MSPRTFNSTNEMFHNFHFQALNTDVDLLLWAAPKESPIVERVSLSWLRNTEARFSRDLPESELSQLNELAGERCLVSDVMLEVLSLSEEYRKTTKGVFSPLDASEPTAQITIQPDTKSIQLPREARMNLDLIVPGWITQRLSAFFQRSMNVKQGLIKVGSLFRVWGRPDKAFDPWVIGIPNPWEKDEEIGSLALAEGAVATYGASEPGKHRQKAQCTVAGSDVVECGIWAKVLAELGPEQGFAAFAEHAPDHEALFISGQGQFHYCGSKQSLGTKWKELPIDHY